VCQTQVLFSSCRGENFPFFEQSLTSKIVLFLGTKHGNYQVGYLTNSARGEMRTNQEVREQSEQVRDGQRGDPTSNKNKKQNKKQKQKIFPLRKS